VKTKSFPLKLLVSLLTFLVAWGGSLTRLFALTIACADSTSKSRIAAPVIWVNILVAWGSRGPVAQGDDKIHGCSFLSYLNL